MRASSLYPKPCGVRRGKKYDGPLMNRIFNPGRFRGQGALITLGSLIGQHVGTPGFPDIDLKDFGSRPFAIFLRWQVNPVIGLPSEPFKVWRRPALPLSQEEPTVEHEVIRVPPLGTVYQFTKPHSVIEVSLNSSGAAIPVNVLPLADGIGFENVLASEVVNIPPGGQSNFRFRAPYITGFMLIGTPSSLTIRGVAVGDLEKVDGWQLLETVGLPVDESQWSDLAGQSHGAQQGLVGAETDAKTAAAQRFARGLNPYGWAPVFQTGEQAPAWAVPTPADMIDDAEVDVLPMVHDALHRPPEDQVSFLRDLVIRPPENPNGQTLPAEDGTAQISPIKLLQMAVATDPFQAVTLGFGTGYSFAQQDLNLDIPRVVLGDRSFFDDGDVADWDFMVTGRWAAGLDGQSDEREYAALIPRPNRVTAPPPPTDLRVHFLAHQRPAVRDGDWVSSSRMSWERLPLDNLSPVASFAAARAETGAAGPATPLLEPRPGADGHMPIGNNENRKDPEYPRQSASDGAFPIPNNPGSVGARYGIATQNLFGIWSPWVTRPFGTSQPDPDPVSIVDAQLRPIDTGTGTVCPADLMIEIVVDWRVRSVDRIDLRGRLFAAATRHTPPPGGLPGGLQMSLGGPAGPVSLTFAGDTPALAAGSVISLDAQGGQQVVPGAAQGDARRYRLTIPGFSLDYASTPHIGLALQARLRERIAPGRIGAWGPATKVSYASDPRARPTNVIDIVRLASQPDARGQCHAIVAWQDIPSAEGYILYQSTETRLLASRGLPGPQPGDTLSTRLGMLKSAFANNPDRNDFTRANDALLTGESLDVALPRGTQDIHLFVVIPMSAGGVEGPWPAGPDADEALIPFAAPKTAVPAPPTIEAQRVEGPGGFAARLRIETRPTSGARPKRIDIHRTRMEDAARLLDSMGPPLVSLSGSTGDWTVVEGIADGTDWIETVDGEDAATGSWRHIWYRAVAWSEDDPVNGIRRGRGRASPAVPVLIPPPDAPPLGALVPSWTGGDPGDVLFDFNAPVPLPSTPLGPHKMTAEVWQQGSDVPLLLTPEPVPLADISEAPSAGVTALWRVADGLDRNYRLLVHRTNATDVVSVTVRLSDPLGRVTERSHRIESGSIIPLPKLSEIDVFNLTGRGRFYMATTDAPLTQFGASAYRVRVTLTPGRPIGERLTAPDLGGRITRPRVPLGIERDVIAPRPGPALDLGTGRARAQFRQRGDDLVFEGDIAEVPVLRPGAQPEGTYSISRQKSGSDTRLTVVAKEDISTIQFEIITPDGRIVSRKARG